MLFSSFISEITSLFIIILLLFILVFIIFISLFLFWVSSSTSTKSKSSSSSFFSGSFSFISSFICVLISSVFCSGCIAGLFGISIIFPKLSKSKTSFFSWFISIFAFGFFSSLSLSESESLSSFFSSTFLILNAKGFIDLLLAIFSSLFSAKFILFKLFILFSFFISLLLSSLTSSKSSSSSSLFDTLFVSILLLFGKFIFGSGLELNWILFNPKSFFISFSSLFSFSSSTKLNKLLSVLLSVFVLKLILIFSSLFSSCFASTGSNFLPIVFSIIIFISIGFIPPCFAPNIIIILVIISIIEP